MRCRHTDILIIYAVLFVIPCVFRVAAKATRIKLIMVDGNNIFGTALCAGFDCCLGFLLLSMQRYVY